MSSFTRRWSARTLLVVLLVATPAGARCAWGQQDPPRGPDRPAAREAPRSAGLTGRWTGDLTLDSGTLPVEMVFRTTGDAITGTMSGAGDQPSAMEQLTLKGDSVFFKVDRFELTGRISGPRITFSMLMWNGVTRRQLLMTRQPDPARPERDDRSPRGG